MFTHGPLTVFFSWCSSLFEWFLEESQNIMLITTFKWEIFGVGKDYVRPHVDGGVAPTVKRKNVDHGSAHVSVLRVSTKTHKGKWLSKLIVDSPKNQVVYSIAIKQKLCRIS